MTLTVQEAENILSKVFSTEIGNGKVSIDVDVGSPGQPLPPGPTVILSVSTFMRMMFLMSKTPSMKIDAIKTYREAFPGTGLVEAKTAIEKLATS